MKIENDMEGKTIIHYKILKNDGRIKTPSVSELNDIWDQPGDLKMISGIPKISGAYIHKQLNDEILSLIYGDDSEMIKNGFIKNEEPRVKFGSFGGSSQTSSLKHIKKFEIRNVIQK